MEQENQNNPQENSGKSYWIYGLIILALIFFTSKCGCSDDSSDAKKAQTELTNSNSDYEKAPSWIIGEWECQSPYGLMRLKITSSTITEIMPDEVSKSGYHMQENTLMTDGSSGTCYELDMANRRIAAGRGYYFHKVK